MPSEITTIKYKFEQQFAQSDKWLIWRGGVLIESIGFYDYKYSVSPIDFMRTFITLFYLIGE